MDFISRQFIVLTKKLRKELRNALSTLHYDLQQQTSAIRDATKRETQDQKPELPPPVVRAELHIPDSIERTRSTHEDRQYRLQKWTAIGTWLAFIAASIYAAVAVLQWREMIGATDAAQRAVDEARRNRIQAEKSLNATIDQFYLDQRAWIGISNQAVERFNAHEFEAGIEFTNSGKTPARKLQRALSVAIHPLPLLDGPTPEDIKIFRFYGAGSLGPQAKTTMQPIATGTPVANQLLNGLIAAHYEAIDKGSDILYVIGEWKYADISERPHTTTFCLYLVKTRATPPAWGLSSCNKFNEMD